MSTATATATPVRVRRNDPYNWKWRADEPTSVASSRATWAPPAADHAVCVTCNPDAIDAFAHDAREVRSHIFCNVLGRCLANDAADAVVLQYVDAAATRTLIVPLQPRCSHQVPRGRVLGALKAVLCDRNGPRVFYFDLAQSAQGLFNAGIDVRGANMCDLQQLNMFTLSPNHRNNTPPLWKALKLHGLWQPTDGHAPSEAARAEFNRDMLAPRDPLWNECWCDVAEGTPAFDRIVAASVAKVAHLRGLYDAVLRHRRLADPSACCDAFAGAMARAQQLADEAIQRVGEKRTHTQYWG